MRIVEALKRMKAIIKEIEDLYQKIQRYSSDEDDQDPVYKSVEEQTKTVQSWLDGVMGLSLEYEKLDSQVKLTNLKTMVTIKVGDTNITKSITAWIKWRTQLAIFNLQAWKCLRDNTGRSETRVVKKDDKEVIVKFRRYWDPKKRDDMMKIFSLQPDSIDAKLEVVNAETDLLDLDAPVAV